MKLLFLFIIINSSLYVGAQSKILPYTKHKTIVIAHRGDHLIAPENSLLSIENAIKDSVDYVEIDLRTTQDGQLILMHDGSVDRMTNGKGKVQELSYDSLRKLKLFNKLIPNSDTLQIPNFREVLSFCKGRVNIYLDFKEANVSEAYKQIQEMKMQNNITVYINSLFQYNEWRKIAPDMPLIISLPIKLNNKLEMSNYLQKNKQDILDGSWEEYTIETVIAAGEMGVPVWADMQSFKENEAYWEKGIKLGLNGIQTDHPGDLVKYLIKINKR